MSCQLVAVAELGLGDHPEVDEKVTLTRRRNIDGSELAVEETVVRNTKTTFNERKIAAWAFPRYAEDALIDAIAYCPTDDQVHKIIEHGNAEGNMMTVKDSTRLPEYATTQVSRNPKKSVWFDEDKSPVPGFVKIQMEQYEDDDFVMAFDRDAPMSNASMGMNGLLKNFGGDDANRVNLFMRDEDAVFDLLQKFLAFRCKFQDTIVEQTITDMTEKGVESALLAVALEVKNATAGGTTFASLGVGLRSFCQTWDPTTSGDPNFSQQSPHFQTKVVVRDPARLFVAIRQYRGSTDDDVCKMFREYGDRVMKLKEAFLDKGYASQFVDLDSLYARMARTRDVDGVASFVVQLFLNQ